MSDEQIEKAAEEYADMNFIEKVVKEYPWPAAKEAYVKAFRDGAAYALGKQAKDARDEEILTVSRADVIVHYQDAQKDTEDYNPALKSGCNNMYQRAVGRRQMLLRLFGKEMCHPDNVDTLEPNVDTLEPKSAEPRFKAGEVAIISHGFEHPLVKDGDKVIILSYHEKGDFYSCAISQNIAVDVDAKHLEPYT